MMPKKAPKRGRRPGISTTAEDIRAHAAAAFARGGYDGVTMREIATLAGVDAALIFHHFGTKRALFERAIDAPDLATLKPLGATLRATRTIDRATNDSVGERMVREFLATWDSPSARITITGLLRSAGADDEARRQLTDVIARTIVTPAIATIDATRGMPKLRAALVAAQLFGIAWTRYVLLTEPIASASAHILGRTFGPSIDATLAGADYGKPR